MNFILVAPIATFIFSAALSLVLSSRRTIQFCIASVASLIGILFSAVIFSLVLKNGFIVMHVGGWVAPFGISLVSDRLSAILCLISNILSFIIIIYSYFDIEELRMRHGYFSMLLAAMAGANGIILTGDLFNLYVWFEVLLISAFGLLILGNTRLQLKGALPYVFINLFASTILLLAIGSLYGLTGSLNMAQLSWQLSEASHSVLTLVVAILFLVSLGIKAAIVPFFFWLPTAYYTPPVSVTAIFSALMTKLAVYALIRLYTLFFSPEMESLQTLILILSALTMVIGVLGAAGQMDFRRILSFHIISQVGYMLMGLGFFSALSLAGATLFIVHNMLIKSSLFLICGVAEKIFKTSRLDEQGELSRSHPILSISFLLSAFSLSGLPPLTGFWGKLLLAQSGLKIHQYLMVGISLIVSLLTLFSMTKIWIYSFWREKQGVQATKSFFFYPVYLLCLIAFSFSLTPGPILEYFIEIGSDLIRPELYIKAVLPMGGTP